MKLNATAATAGKIWKEDRFTSTSMDACTLLGATGEWVKEFSEEAKKFFFVFADVPWGCLPWGKFGKCRDYDTPLTPDQINKIIDGIKLVLNIRGTGCIRLGDDGQDQWRSALRQKGFYVEPTRTVGVEEPFYKRQSYLSHTLAKPSTHQYVIFHHKGPSGHAASWHQAKDPYGALKPFGGVKSATLWTGCPHVRNVHKLHDSAGKILRVPENHINEMIELINCYVPASGSALDFCAGTATFLLACIFTNRVCHVNDRDEAAMAVAISRAKRFLMFSGTPHTRHTPHTTHTNTHTHTNKHTTHKHKHTTHT